MDKDFALSEKNSTFAGNYIKTMEYEIIISNATDLLRVSALDIMGIQAEGNYSLIYMNDGEEILVAFQLGQLEQMFDEQLGKDAQILARIGKSVLINVDYLYSIDMHKQKLTVRSSSGYKTTLPASKEALRHLKAFFDNKIAKGGTK